MTPLEFDQALDRWGADLDQWPGAAAERGRACLAASPDARRSLAAARQVDAYLQGLARGAAPPHLAARIVASVPRPDGVERLLDWFTARLWRPAVLALAVTVGGYLAGASIDQPVDTELADAVMSLAFNDLYAELDDAQ